MNVQFRLARMGDATLGFQQLVTIDGNIRVYELVPPKNADKMLLGLYDQDMNYINPEIVKLQDDLVKVEKAFNPNEPRDKSGKWSSGGSGATYQLQLFAIRARKEITDLLDYQVGEEDCTGHCTEVSEVLLRSLKSKYPKAHIEDGTFIPAYKSKYFTEMSDHAWVVVPELGVYVDPTFDQYHNVTGSKEKVRIGNLTSRYYAETYKKDLVKAYNPQEDRDQYGRWVSSQDHFTYPRESDDKFYQGNHQAMGKEGIWLVPQYHEPKVGETYEFYDKSGKKKVGKVKFYDPEKPIQFEDKEGNTHELKAFHQ